MEAVILVLCIALTLVSVMALISGGLKLKRGLDELKGVEAPPSGGEVISVKQRAGEVTISYSAQAAAAEETAVAEEPAAGEEEDGVLIPRAEKLTYAQKYERLPAKSKKLLDAFVAYITEKPDCDACERTSALLCRYKKAQIAKAAIRRDCAVLSFPIVNPELGRMVREEKLKSIKMQPAQIKLSEESDLALAKQTADIALDSLKEEEEYKLERRREARREAAKKRKESEGGEA